MKGKEKIMEFFSQRTEVFPKEGLAELCEMQAQISGSFLVVIATFQFSGSSP